MLESQTQLTPKESELHYRQRELNLLCDLEGLTAVSHIVESKLVHTDYRCFYLLLHPLSS